jgi:hypothetical protein
MRLAASAERPAGPGAELAHWSCGLSLFLWQRLVLAQESQINALAPAATSTSGASRPQIEQRGSFGGVAVAGHPACETNMVHPLARSCFRPNASGTVRRLRYRTHFRYSKEIEQLLQIGCLGASHTRRLSIHKWRIKALRLFVMEAILAVVPKGSCASLAVTLACPPRAPFQSVEDST